MTQERSVATRLALLDAALDCLVERGYAATTTIETARRAGVSRGAQLHHFPTKAELVSAAVDHLLQRRLEEFRKGFADLDPDIDAIDGAIDLLWSMHEGPTFVAWAELWIAARTDPVLAEKMREVTDQFDAGAREIYLEILPAAPGADSDLHLFGFDFAFIVMAGAALDRLVSYRNQRPPQDYIFALKAISHTFNV